MRRRVSISGAGLLLLALAACGPSASNPDGGGPPRPDGPSGNCTTEGATRCAGGAHQRCENGSWVDVETCATNKVCHQDLGCVDCNPDFANTCVGDAVHTCNDDGTVGDFVSMCDFESCQNGICDDPCGEAAANRSYIGCEYWPVDLDNAVEVWGPPLPFPFPPCTAYSPDSKLVNDVPVCWDGSGSAGECDYGGSCPGGYTCQMQPVCVLDAQRSPFAIVLSNPSETDMVTVTLTNATGQSHMQTVSPGQVVSIFPQMVGFGDQSLQHSGIRRNAYKLTSSKPIVAYQFNPLDNVGVFSNDGSLLLPQHTFDTTYYVLSFKTLTRRPTTNDYNSYAAVVASAEGTTNVTVTPSANVRAGEMTPAINAGQTQMFALQQFDVLNLEAVADGDLSGTVITADQPVGVYAGHEATTINSGTQQCCADHLEDQVFPSSTWGKAYAIARTKQRASEMDMIRVMAQRDGTAVTFNPAPAMGTCGTLNAGAFCEVFISGDTEITGTEPILVGHYILSTGGTAANSGDPAMAFGVPTEQFRTSYTFLIPQQYNENHVSLVAPAGGPVILDGNDVTSQMAPFGSGAFIGGRIAVQAGQHKLDCPNTCGVEVYGYSEAVSYLFAGGLDLKQIVVD